MLVLPALLQLIHMKHVLYWVSCLALYMHHLIEFLHLTMMCKDVSQLPKTDILPPRYVKGCICLSVHSLIHESPVIYQAYGWNYALKKKKSIDSPNCNVSREALQPGLNTIPWAFLPPFPPLITKHTPASSSASWLGKGLASEAGPDWHYLVNWMIRISRLAREADWSNFQHSDMWLESTPRYLFWMWELGRTLVINGPTL